MNVLRRPLGRGGLVVGVAALVALALVLGRNGDPGPVGTPLSRLKGVTVGAGGGGDLTTAARARARAFADWSAVLSKVGLDAVTPASAAAGHLPQPPSWAPADPLAGAVVRAGIDAADAVLGRLGVRSRLVQERIDHPQRAAALLAARDRVLACLAGVWGAGLVPLPRLVAQAPAGTADALTRGARARDASACDLFPA
ncbi:MAG: hypothetical protein U0Y82_01050 [Thermoleophilia bacterium]